MKRLKNAQDILLLYLTYCMMRSELRTREEVAVSGDGLRHGCVHLGMLVWMTIPNQGSCDMSWGTTTNAIYRIYMLVKVSYPCWVHITCITLWLRTYLEIQDSLQDRGKRKTMCYIVPFHNRDHDHYRQHQKTVSIWNEFVSAFHSK